MRDSTPPDPALKSLRPEELLFLNAYFSNGGNRVRAYQSVYPNAKYDTANAQAYRIFQKPYIKAEIARRTRESVGITRQWGHARLLDYEAKAFAKGDYVAGASIVMDAMRLGGFLVEKQEIKQVSDHERDSIRRIVAESLSTTN